MGTHKGFCAQVSQGKANFDFIWETFFGLLFIAFLIAAAAFLITIIQNGLPPEDPAPSAWLLKRLCSAHIEMICESVGSIAQLCLTLCPHGLQHARLTCPSPIPGVCSNSCPLSWWCHPTISSSVIPFSSCLQSLPSSGSFPVSQFFSSGVQNIGVSASVSVFPVNIQYWFPLGWTGLICLQSRGLSRVLQHQRWKTSILRCSAFFIVQLSHPYMTTRKTIALTRWTFVGKVMSLLFNMLSRLVIAFLSRRKCLLISWMQSSSEAIFGVQEDKVCHCFHCFPIYLPWSDGTRCHALSFLNVEFQASFFILLFHLHLEAV